MGKVITKGHYDWIIVGSGLFGATFAREMLDAGKSVLVIEKRAKTGGNIRCEKYNGVIVHNYGAHIFHTSNPETWEYVNSRIKLTPIVHSPMARTGDGRMLSLPFSMRTFNALWPEVITPAQAKEKIKVQTQKWKDKYSTPANLEQKALTLVGEDLFDALIRNYTEKQWHLLCTELPPEIITRIPLRYSWDASYFDDCYVGVPEEGYNPLIDSLLDGADIITGVDYLEARNEFKGLADKTLYTGCIDAFYGYSLGRLGYRSLLFDQKIESLESSQGCSVMNFTGMDVSYTRCIEHHYFAPKGHYEEIVKSYEYPADYIAGNEPYYPIVSERNKMLYRQYANLGADKDGVFFGGRLGLYEYMDMDDAIERARKMARRLLLGERSPLMKF